MVWSNSYTKLVLLMSANVKYFIEFTCGKIKKVTTQLWYEFDQTIIFHWSGTARLGLSYGETHKDIII